MSNKFMRIKKIVVPIVSLVIMMGSMVGCSVVKSDELLELINSGSAVTIELAQPSYSVDVKGEEGKFEWVQLDQLKTYDKGFRQGIDEIFNVNIVTEQGKNGKNGVLFVDAEGNRNGNAVLADALRNKTFVEKYWGDAKVKKAIGDLAKEVYTDAGESEVQAIVASLNAYYNLFTDRVNPETFNFNESLSREDFYSAVYRSENGVDEGLVASSEFESQVGGATEHTKYAEEVADFGFLQVDNKGLDENSYGGAISRAEAVYMLVNMHFEEEFKNADVKAPAFTDTKNGGDLALKLKFKEENKETKEIVEKDRWQAFTLAYMVQNPDKGLQEDLYKAMVVAKDKKLITSSDSRWDEPLSKGEAILMIMNTHLAKNKIDGYVSNDEYGKMIVEEVPVDSEVETPVVDEANSAVDEIGIVAIDPDTIPKDGFITYREIRNGIDEYYKSLLKTGYSKEEAIEEVKIAAVQDGTTLDELNRLVGYNPIGETKPIASKPTAPTGGNNGGGTTTPTTPTTPSTPKPSEPKPTQPAQIISEHGYPITESDKDGNGRADFLEDKFSAVDGTSSLPSGTPNPVDMP